MRISLVFILLLWSNILHEAQGIRLDEGFLPIRNKQIQKEKKITSIKTNTVNVAAAATEVAFLCKGGHCTGKNRKLSTTTAVSTTNTFSKDGGNGANSLKPTEKDKSGNHEEVDENLNANSSDHQQYVDIVDINEMDYSPAGRKPPIHN